MWCAAHPDRASPLAIALAPFPVSSKLSEARGFIGDATHRCLTLSSDGRRLYSGSYDRTVRAWDTVTGARMGLRNLISTSIPCLLPWRRSTLASHHHRRVREHAPWPQRGAEPGRRRRACAVEVWTRTLLFTVASAQATRRHPLLSLRSFCQGRAPVFGILRSHNPGVARQRRHLRQDILGAFLTPIGL